MLPASVSKAWGGAEVIGLHGARIYCAKSTRGILILRLLVDGMASLSRESLSVQIELKFRSIVRTLAGATTELRRNAKGGGGGIHAPTGVPRACVTARVSGSCRTLLSVGTFHL